MTDGKSLDEAAATKPAALSGNPAAGVSESDGPDLKRRRLIRGAAGIAPVVITLRSGALAASSCIPTKAIVTTVVDSAGNINDTTGYSSGSSATIVGGDNCIVGFSQSASCPSPLIDASNVAGAQQGKVSTGTTAGATYACPSVNSTGTNIAIISASITSFA